MAAKKLHFNRTQLYEGCMLASIVHAIMVRKYPDLAYEHSWDGINYSTNNGLGCRGTITFSSKYTVAVFRDENVITQNMELFFDTSDIDLMNVANEEALQYMLESRDFGIFPTISSAFWGIHEDIFSRYDFSYLNTYGVHLIENQIRKIEEAMGYWIEYYEMDKDEVRLAMKLFHLRCNEPETIIKLNEIDLDILSENGIIQNECISSFNEVGIII